MRLLHIFAVLAHAIALGQDSIPVTKDTLQETNTALTLDTYDFDDFPMIMATLGYRQILETFLV